MLLFVFLLAAAAALTIYLELPKVAFESQRLREDLLVSRGLQYRRAIQLYVRKKKQYPQNVEALEKDGNLRFLRKRYIDPMTGKDEWRVIKIGPNGEYVDSLVFKAKNPLEGDMQANQNTFITEGPSMGSTGATGGTGAATVANRLRQSDMQCAPGTGVPGPGGPVGPDGQPQDPNVVAQQQ